MKEKQEIILLFIPFKIKFKTTVIKKTKVKNVKKTSKFDIELLDRILAVLMKLEITSKSRYLCGLVLSSHEFANSEQIQTFLPNFMNKMTHDQMKIEAYNATNCCIESYTETEDFIKKMTDINGTTDFLKEFLIPTNQKVFVNSCINNY